VKSLTARQVKFDGYFQDRKPGVYARRQGHLAEKRGVAGRIGIVATLSVALTAILKFYAAGLPSVGARQ
jgi:hypothetical protein